MHSHMNVKYVLFSLSAIFNRHKALFSSETVSRLMLFYVYHIDNQNFFAHVSPWRRLLRIETHRRRVFKLI